MSENNGQILSDRHRADLDRSGLSKETIRACQFATVRHPDHIAAILGWDKPAITLGECLEMPFLNPNGTRSGYSRLKPDRPRKGTDGKLIKYEAPKGIPLKAYFPPRTRKVLTDATVPLILTEGEKKSAKADQEGFPSIGLCGVWAWQKKREGNGPRELIPDLNDVVWQDRKVAIVFDSDAATKSDIRLSENELAKVLAAFGARVKIVRLPGGENELKVGLDDYLLGHSPEDLRKLIDDVPQHPRSAARRRATA